MKYDFTSVIDRTGKDSSAWENIPVPNAEIAEGFDRIPMWVADMNFQTAPSVCEAITKRLEHQVFGYFNPSEDYYNSIINWQKVRNGVEGLTKEAIGYENGVLGGVVAALQAFSAPGEAILVHSPTYTGFTSVLNNNGRRAVHTELKRDAEGIWRMDYEDMDKKIKENHIHLAIFCSPHNPSGRVWEREEIEAAMEVYRKNDRKQLLKVPKLGPKAFEQCAGFLRIADGENPLDATSVHPESYPATMELLKKLELSMEDVRMLQAEAKKGRAAQNTSGADSKNTSGDAARQNVSAKNKANRKDRRQNGFNIRNTDTAMGRALAAAMQGMTLDADNGGTDKKGANPSGRSGAGALNAANASTGAAAGSSTSGSQKAAAVSALERRIPDKKKLAEELGIGEITLTDIVRELEKPARDPREDMPRPILRSDVLDMKDLKPGMVLKGTVRNVIDFGVFVDIGVHQDGLVHISQITDRFIKHPLEAVSVGDIVDVKVLDVDPVKKRIGLTMRLDQK